MRSSQSGANPRLARFINREHETIVYKSRPTNLSFGSTAHLWNKDTIKGEKAQRR